jgi:hypothetical protein
MNRTLLMTFFLLIAASCLNEEPNTYRRWELDRYQGSPDCTFTTDSLPAKNEIIETFLGWDDSVFTQTTLLLLDNGDFNIIKNNSVCTAGTWERTKKSLRLHAGADSWNLEVIKQNDDSLVLKADAFPYMWNMEIVLK